MKTSSPTMREKPETGFVCFLHIEELLSWIYHDPIVEYLYEPAQDEIKY